jgi:chemosensory pili system protein ChpA (sensor histidine kinase/response regulator)
MNQAIDFSTLKWVKQELDATLKDARQALEAYVENPDDEQQLVTCADHLHQVQGTLQMVEIYGAALLAEEMEQVAKALVEGGVTKRDDAYELLMRSILQLPDYLERLSEGHRDVPLVLLPLLNDLRAARGQHLLSENALFAPDLLRSLPDFLMEGRHEEPAESARDVARRMRHGYQRGLLAWIRKDGAGVGLQHIREVLDALQHASREDAAVRLWWAAGGLVEALESGLLEASVSSTLLLGQVDRQIKRLIDDDEAALGADPNTELLKNLLFYVASADGDNERVAAIKQHYGLAALLPSADEVAQARDSLSGRNAELMRTVSDAIKEDLTRVKDGLDVFLRGAQDDASDLKPLAQLLHQIGDTLGMLGEGASRKIVQEQAAALEQIADGAANCDEGSLMEVASALLAVDARLAAMSGAGAQAGPRGGSGQGAGIPDSDYGQILGVVAQEAVADLSRAKDAIVGCIDGSWDFDQLATVPPLLHQIKGGLLLLGEEYAAAIVDAINDYVRTELLEAKQVPGQERLDILADSISSIEYYLEGLKDNRIFGVSVLDVAAASLEKLGHPVSVPQDSEPDRTDEEPAAEMEVRESDPWEQSEEIVLEPPEVEDFQSGTDGDPLAEEVDSEQIELASIADSVTHMDAEDGDESSASESAPAEEEAAGPTAAGVSNLVLAEDVDEEILGIFIEEADEEFASITENFPSWRQNPDDGDALATMRRSYHTLKGSGRLVGAVGIGEFAWAFENMLNRVIDGSIEAGDVMFALVEHGISALRELIDQIKSGSQPTMNVQALMDCADVFSRGEQLGMDDVEAALAAVPPPSESSALPDAAPDASQSTDAEAGMDPVLFEIFHSETRGHTATIREFIDGCRGATGACKVTEPLIRALHTLHGSARMAGADGVAGLASELEKYTKALMAEQLPLPPAGIAALEEAANVVEDVVFRIGQGGVDVPDCTQIREHIAGLPRTRSDAEREDDAQYVEYDFGLDFVDDDYAASSSDEDRGPDAEQADVQPMPTRADADEPSDEVDAWAAQSAAPAPDDEVIHPEPLSGATESADADAWPVSEPDEEAVAEQFHGSAEPGSATDDTDSTVSGGFDWSGEYTGGDAGTVSGESDVHDPAVDPASVGDDDFSVTAEESGAEQLGVAEDSLAASVGPGDAVLDLDLAGTGGAVEAQETRLPDGFSEESDTDSVADSNEWMSASAVPEPSASAEDDDGDAELVEIFLEEGDEILENIELTLQNWIRNPESAEYMHALQRDLHTLKGGARMAGIQALGDLSHTLESLLNRVVDGHVAASRRLYDILQIAQDRLVQMLEQVRNRQAVDSAAGLIQELESLQTGAAADAFVEPVPDAAPETPAAVPEQAAAGVDRELPATASTVESEEEIETEVIEGLAERRNASRVQQELVRVRADLLDALVNYAGEISIYRARLEQQVGAFGFNLVEFEQTVNRLREQLRKLEIETEAQILFRYERESAEDGQEDFDPLELDRYSQLQQLSRSLMESVSDLSSIQGLLANNSRESETLLLQQSRVNTELQEGLMRTRMVPFSRLAPRLRRIVRQTSHELGKQAELSLEGAEGEMDRTVIDRIVPPLEHMLRNALSHGIETPAQRSQAGKAAAGQIKISLARDASDVVIRIADDGAGMDLAAIRRKALERGLLAPDAEPTDHDVMQFVLETGFSTAEQITQVAGRGVGMDVVNSEVKQLGGSLEIDSRFGAGTTFTIRLPFTLAINQALLVQAAEENFAIPLTSIEGIVRVSRDDLERYLADADSTFGYAGHEYRVQKLADLLGSVPGPGPAATKRVPVLLVRSGEHRLALAVDSLMGSREIVVKSVGPQLSTVRGISGATILGDGRVVLILDLGALARAGGAAPQVAGLEPVAAANETGAITVMVVDDSITVRKITARLLERNDMNVITAKDGVDAVTKLQEQLPDVMLLDIEMPRMDGFELATHVRNEERLRHIPMIMITSRTGDKHRKRAMEIGVDRYLGKPYQESDLLESITGVLSERTADA